MPRALHLALALALAFGLAALAFALARSTADGPQFDLFAAAVPSPQPAPTGTATPAPAFAVAPDALAHAPLGRTGIAVVDATIDALVAVDDVIVDALTRVPWAGIVDCASAQPTTLDAARATRLFADTRPPLHSVLRPQAPSGAAQQYAVIFGHAQRNGSDAGDERVWQIDVVGTEVTSGSTYCGFTDVVYEPPISEIERYLLLPPEADLPAPVVVYDVAPATGQPTLDAIVGEALGGDTAALGTRLRGLANVCAGDAARRPGDPDCVSTTTAEVLAVGRCTSVQFEPLEDARRELEVWLAGTAPALHAIAELPAGYLPSGDALVLLTRNSGRYRWESTGIVVTGEEITGLLLPCGIGRPEWLYPPTIRVGPFTAAIDNAGPTWSGIPAVDRVIVALSNGNSTRVRAMFDPVLIGCVTAPTGIGSPPVCSDGEAHGTLVPVLPVTDCEIGYVRDREFDALADRLSAIAPRLFAVTAPPRGFAEFWRLAEYTLLILDAAPGSEAPTPTIAVSETGIVGFASGCGASLTTNLLRPASTPAFLLPPPD